MQVQFGNTNYVVGLDWSRVSGTDAKDEMQIIADELGAKYGLLREIRRDNHQVESQAGFSRDRADARGYSAAALLADSVDQVLLVHPVDDDTVWMCVVVDHQVLAGSDVLVARKEVSARLRTLLFGVLEDVDGLSIVAPTPLAQELGIDDAEDGSFETLTGNAQPNKKHRVTRIGGPGLVTILLGVFLLLVAGMFYMMSGSDSEPEALKVDFGKGIEASIKEAIEPTGPSQNELLERARQEEIGWLTSQFSAQPPQEIISSLFRATTNYPRQIAGFELLRFEWVAEKPTQVRLIWTRGIEGRLAGLRGGLADAVEVTMEPDGRQAKSIHTLPSWEPRQVDLLPFLASQHKAAETLIDALAVARYKWKSAPHTPPKRPEPIAGITDQTTAFTRQLALFATDLGVSGSNLARFENLAYLFSRHAKTLQLTTITIQAGSVATWEIAGVIYEAP